MSGFEPDDTRSSRDDASRGAGNTNDASDADARRLAAARVTPEAKVEALRVVNRRQVSFGFLWEWAKVLSAAILLFLVVRTFFVEAFKIPSGSMEQTLQVGDFLLVNKLVYGAEVPFVNKRLPRLRTPKRGDVLVFEYPKDLTKYYVKRVVGTAGDTLAMRDGRLYRDGALVDEAYVWHGEQEEDPGSPEFRWQTDYLVRAANASIGYHPSRNNWGPLVVPEQSYFVLGDNRDNSEDSRYWGFVPDSLVRGRPILIYYSFAPDSVDRMAWLTHIRWSRVGRPVH